MAEMVRLENRYLSSFGFVFLDKETNIISSAAGE